MSSVLSALNQGLENRMAQGARRRPLGELDHRTMRGLHEGGTRRHRARTEGARGASDEGRLELVDQRRRESGAGLAGAAQGAVVQPLADDDGADVPRAAVAAEREAADLERDALRVLDLDPRLRA